MKNIVRHVCVLPLFFSEEHPTIMQFFTNKTLLTKAVLGSSFFLLVIILLSLYMFEQKSEYTVELREDGFYPQELTINKGDKVIFTTTQGKPFWPASSIHPSHEIYPEFDAKEPIEPGQQWSFVFEKQGIWKYHDHLFPLFTGTIIVTEPQKNLSYMDNPCGDLKGNKRQCWEQEILQTLNTKGIAAAFKVVATLYTAEPEFARDCHGYVHEIGEEAYELFAAGKEMELSSKTSYCGYGFYHGFMETLLFTTGDIEQAHEFCTYVSQELANETTFAGEGACYHGIGHGVVDANDPQVWGNARAMIEPGLQLCEAVGETELQLFVCGNGVFNALAIMFRNSQYNLSINSNDPFWVCKLQSKPYFKKACYHEMSTVIMFLADLNFLEALEFINTITEKEYISTTVLGLAQHTARTYLVEYSHSKMILDCRTLEKYLHTPCINGFSIGIMKHGPPENGYVGAINFCQNELLSKEEQQSCLEQIFFRASGYYSSKKYLEICAATDKKYRATCLGLAPIL